MPNKYSTMIVWHLMNFSFLFSDLIWLKTTAEYSFIQIESIDWLMIDWKRPDIKSICQSQCCLKHTNWSSQQTNKQPLHSRFVFSYLKKKIWFSSCVFSDSDLKASIIGCLVGLDEFEEWSFRWIWIILVWFFVFGEYLVIFVSMFMISCIQNLFWIKSFVYGVYEWYL